MSRDFRLYLEDIVASCSKILKYSEHLDFQEFVEDGMAHDAILRNLEIIGEAAKNIPVEVRLRYPEVNWRGIAGLRDVMAHTYYALQNETLWSIIQEQVPRLYEDARRILQREDEAHP